MQVLKYLTLGTTISNVDILDILVPDARSRLQGRSVHQATKRDAKKRKMDDTAAEKVLAYTYKSEKYVYANNALCKYISNSEGRSVKASYREYVYI